MVAVAVLALAVWPPWHRIAWGVTLPPRESDLVACLAAGRRRVGRFEPLLNRDEVETARAVDFRRDVVVAVFARVPDGCGRVDVTGLRRARTTLAVKVRVYSVARPNVGCLFAVSEAHDVVTIPRSLVGRPLPRRVVVHVAA